MLSFREFFFKRTMVICQKVDQFITDRRLHTTLGTSDHIQVPGHYFCSFAKPIHTDKYPEDKAFRDKCALYRALYLFITLIIQTMQFTNALILSQSNAYTRIIIRFLM